jgi:hypothetical protein
MPIFQTLALGGFWALLRAQKPEAVALMDPGLVEMCRRGEAVTQEQYVEAVAQRAALGQRLRLFFDRFDLLLAPTMPIPAAYADPRTDELPNPRNAWSWVTYTYVFNLTKNPSCSIPCGFADGLPIGLMVRARFTRISVCCRPVGLMKKPPVLSGRALNSVAASTRSAALPMPPSKPRYRRTGAYEGGRDGEQGAEAVDP